MDKYWLVHDPDWAGFKYNREKYFLILNPKT